MSGSDPESADQDGGERSQPQAERHDEVGNPDQAAEQDTAGEVRQLNQAFNFWGQTSANTIGFGQSDGQFGRPLIERKSGILTRDEVARPLRYYVEPAPFDAAMRILASHHIVALFGPEGCGKKAGTLELARRICPVAEKYTLMPPTKSLLELSEYKYRSDDVHLVHDWMPVSSESRATASFDLGQVVNRLNKAGAYLVMTFEGTGGLQALLGEMCVQWSAPEPEVLLDTCLAKLNSQHGEPELEQLRECAREIRSPQLIVRLAEAAMQNVKNAIDQASERESEEVARWFQERPQRWKVHAATALTFLSGIGERNFERQLAALTEISKGDTENKAEDERPAAPDDDEELPQSRWRRAKEAGLDNFIVERDRQAWVGSEHRPGFRTTACRMYFMAELNRRYGHELWGPVCDWLDRIADQPISEVQIAAGYGIALLARYALNEVTATYLTQWSVGGIRHRLMTVSVLWSMAEDDQLAAAALKIAVSWVRNMGPERAITAAIAFGGPLGQRYPSEAMRWLWVLAKRGERISAIARPSMGQLFAIEAESDADKSTVLRFLLQKIRPLLAPDASIQERRSALELVIRVLAATQTSSDTPVVAHVIRTKPADFSQLGELWAAVLNVQRSRDRAIDSLRGALDALADDANSVDLAGRLGRAILPRLMPRALEVLKQELPDPKRARKISAQIFTAFLAQRQVIGAIR
jgi:hypothetical protein